MKWLTGGTALVVCIMSVIVWGNLYCGGVWKFHWIEESASGGVGRLIGGGMLLISDLITM